ncbi:MAG: hypothetical protein QGF90_06295 [Gammaproteobacteria bacterium]|nr:hypothetical protein [Gammaproteobacteria bacterium]|tara:strand:- start:161 stop:745 length:585 start_codon:yes stop_codon:yes gene_type:complete
MEISKYFGSDEANSLWEAYLNKVDLLLLKISDDQRNAIRKEPESHVFEAVQGQTSSNELERLEAALKDLGDPDEIVPPMIAAALIGDAKNSNNPLGVLRVVTVHLGQRIVNSFRWLAIALLYITGFVFVTMAILKLFSPEHVGFFTSETGQVSFGLIGNIEQKTEHLGYFIIPIALLLGFGLFKISKLMLKYSR